MNTENRTITNGLLVLLAVLTMPSSYGLDQTDGCGKNDGCGAGKDGKVAAQAVTEVKEAHGSEDGHGHAAKATAPSTASIDERAAVECEHKIPIYQCDECRYEAGVVKLDASLMKMVNGSGIVQTQAISRTKMPEMLAATGEVGLNENATVHISPRIAGIIETVSGDIGKRVKAGDALLTLASAELGKALTDYERNQTLSDLSEKVLARETRLKEQKVGSEQDMINARMVFEQHRTDLKASEQMLHVLGLTDEDLAKARDPSHGVSKGVLTLRAPTAGTIIEKHAVAGEVADRGKDLMLLSDLSTVWIWATVQARDLSALLSAESRGKVVVEIKVSAFPNQRFSGMLDYVGATMNEQTRTVKVRATIANPGFLLRPGMFCDATISLGANDSEEVVATPRGALFSDEGKYFVFKHWKDDFYARQDVRKGREFFGLVEIIEGLQSGDTVVTDGAFLLKSDVLREKMGAGCAD